MDIMGDDESKISGSKALQNWIPAAARGRGTVLLLHDEETLTGPLLALFEREKLPAINYSVLVSYCIRPFRRGRLVWWRAFRVMPSVGCGHTSN